MPGPPAGRGGGGGRGGPSVPVVDPLSPLANPTPVGQSVGVPAANPMTTGPNEPNQPATFFAPAVPPAVPFESPSGSARPQQRYGTSGENLGVGVDVAFMTATAQSRIAQRAAQGRAGSPFVRYPTPDPNVEGVAWFLWDFADGMNRNVGYGDKDAFRYSDADGVDSRFQEHLMLSQLMNTATGPDPSGSLNGIHSTPIFNTLAVGAGAGANVSLWIPTSATDFTPSARTYSPGSAIWGLRPIVIGGITNAERLAVLRASAAIEILSDLASTPTSAGTMHADTSGAWALMQVPGANLPMLIGSQNAIRQTDATAAIGDQPTVKFSNIPDGGCGLDWLSLGGATPRVFWQIPPAEDTDGVFVFGSESLIRLASTTLEGDDLQFHNEVLGLEGVAWARIIRSRQGIVASDGKRTVFWDGTVNDLRQFEDRKPDSDREWRTRGSPQTDDDLYVLVNQRASPNGTGNTKEHYEWYDWNTGRWHVVSARTTLSSTGSYGILPANGGLPYHRESGFFGHYSDGSHRWMFAPPSGYNPYAFFAQTSGAGSSTGTQWATTGNITSPEMRVPGLEGLPMVPESIHVLGTVGGTSASVDVEVGREEATANSFTRNVQATFNARIRRDRHYARFPGNTNVTTRPQVRVTLTQGSSTRETPQPMPIIVTFLVFKDKRVRPPRAVWGR